MRPEKKIFFNHIRFNHDYELAKLQGDASINPKGGITVAFETVNGTTIKVAYARCSSTDHYDKKFGRKIATGRLGSRAAFDVHLPKLAEMNIGEVADVASDMSLQHITETIRDMTPHKSMEQIRDHFINNAQWETLAILDYVS